ncbi:hypothetical protein Cgig2_028809 [Carnegiea gigantea]|uniref:Uncharacterized protein n=1 Tax=Carnegiea gigantea TaxID=171969 RepID=A0A9Q1GUZ4_9CARY|nr:hypothetical protein Cgig2_028809 [Carnegiea gigantea]
MMKLLQEYKEKKRQKKLRIARHLEDEIPRSFNRNDYADDDEEEDDQLAHARYQSLEQHSMRMICTLMRPHHFATMLTNSHKIYTTVSVDTCCLRVVMIEAEVEEEEKEVRMRWVLPVALDHQLITLVIMVVMPLLKMVEEVDVPQMNNQEIRHKLIIA